MQIEINEDFVERRAKLGRNASLVGLAALIAGLFTISSLIWLSYLLLFVGLVSAAVASYVTNQFVREPRADRVFAATLGGLDKRFALYSYYLPVAHVVASHHGLTVLLANGKKGEITYTGKRWKHKSGWRKILQLFGEPSLGKPDLDVQSEMARLSKWVQKSGISEEIPISGVVVFTHPEAQLNITDPPVPIVPSSELAAFLKTGLSDLPTLSTATQRLLRRQLDAVVAEKQPEPAESADKA